MPAIPPPVVATIALGACWTLLVLGRRSVFLTSLLIFFTLGFWVKLIFAEVTGAAFIEPIGAFNGSASQWDEALAVVTVAYMGLAGALAVNLFLPALAIREPAISRSKTYRKIELPLAVVSTAIALAAFAANWYFGFDKIGIDHAVIVPNKVFIAVSFVVLWGAALWLGCMGHWAWAAGRLPMVWLLLLGLFEGVLAGISNASRSRYIFHAMGFVFGWLATRARMRLPQIAGVGVAGVALLGLSLVLVSHDRMVMYAQGGTAAENSASSDSASVDTVQEPVVEISSSQMVNQIGRLFIARWIGVEGVMSVVGYEGKGADLFWRGITERKDAANDGIYEAISHSSYKKLPGLTFLTTAGSVAILYYSGNLLVVLFGVFALALTGILIERSSLLLTDSPFASSIMSVMFANFICQVNQPAIPFKFTVLMLMACCMICAFRVLVVRFDHR